MNLKENVRTERLLALLSLGIAHALKNGAISSDEAERLLFSPGTIGRCSKIGAPSELIDLIHVGTELDAIKRLISLRKWEESLEIVQTNALAVLRQTDESCSQLEPWIAKLIAD
ncbi:MAG: hypothetical protein JWN70_5259 [Planctomycetaceae bacterium]|nr:hypothetical protein [Planctomycetaceae bacterium]